MTTTEQSLAAIFRHCDEVAEGKRPARSEQEGKEAAEAFLGVKTESPRPDVACPAPCSALDALDYALYICETRGKMRHYNESYRAACTDVFIFIAAAKERLETGGELYDHAVTQNADMEAPNA